MCTATAGAAFGMTNQLIGGWSAAGAQRDYHNANANYLESMNELNQIQANQAVDSTMYAAGMQSSAVRNKGISLAKSQRAAMGSRGLSQSATYQNILDDSITRSERDAMAILYNADVQAKNIRTNAALQQAQYLSQAAQERAAGKIAYNAGILSTVGQFADSWSKWSNTSMGQLGSKNNWKGVNARNIPIQSYDSLYSVDSSKPSYSAGVKNKKWTIGGTNSSLWGGVF